MTPSGSDVRARAGGATGSVRSLTLENVEHGPPVVTA